MKRTKRFYIVLYLNYSNCSTCVLKKKEKRYARKKNNRKVTLPPVVIYIYIIYRECRFTRSAFNVFTNSFHFLYFDDEPTNLGRFLNISFLHNFTINITENLLFNFNSYCYSKLRVFNDRDIFSSSFYFSFCARRSGKINRWLMIASEENSSRVYAWQTHISSASTYGSRGNQVSKLRDEDGSISRGIET